MSCSIPNCICKLPGARTDMHGQPPKPCAECGGQTGRHALTCSQVMRDPRIVGFDLSDVDFSRLVDGERR